MQGVPCHIQVKEGGTRKFSAKNKSGLFPRFCDEHDSRRVSFAQFCFWEDNFWMFCRGLLLGPVPKKSIRNGVFGPQKAKFLPAAQPWWAAGPSAKTLEKC